MKRLLALSAVVLFVLALAPTASGAAGGKEKDTVVQLLAINDFHGPQDRQLPRRDEQLPRERR
jgi:hypothetical protein